MAIRRPQTAAPAPRAEEEAPKPAARTRAARTPEPPEVDDVYEAEDEDEAPKRSSVVQAGWGAAARLAAASPGDYSRDVKLGEVEILLKFIEDEPYAVYRQHFINEMPQGERKSFTCLEQGCPLCDDLLHKPDRKFGFNVVNVSAEAGIEHQSLTVGPRLLGMLSSFNDSKKGPLSKHFWSIARIGKGRDTSYVVNSVRSSDLAEEWETAEEDIMAVVKSVEPYTSDIVRTETKEELRDIVDAVTR